MGVSSLLRGHQDIFQGRSEIDALQRTGLWKTRGSRAGDAVGVVSSVGVISDFGNHAFSSIAAIMVVSASRFSLDCLSHPHIMGTSGWTENFCATA